MKRFYEVNKIIIALLFITLVTLIFQRNIFSFADANSFRDFQKDSEALVVSSIAAKKFNIEEHGFHLGFVEDDKKATYPESIYSGFRLIKRDKLNHPDFLPYKSQYGLQGVVFSKLYGYLRLANISKLQLINSILLAVVIFMLFYCYRRIYDERFAWIFLGVLISSPWVVLFARNLYWTPVLWFFPALLAALLYVQKNKIMQFLLLAGITLSMVIKCLSGYEYITSITLFACSVFIVAPYFKPNGNGVGKNILMALYVFIACIIGFSIALTLHAGMRGDTLLAGLNSIYENEVKYRTYGDPLKFDLVVRPSLEASPISVLFTYITDWKTSLFLWVPGTFFKYLLMLSGVGIMYKFIIRSKTKYRDLVMFLFFFIVPASWFVLAKAHSYVHTHLNYVLWYFGFVAALIYISIDCLSVFIYQLYCHVKIINKSKRMMNE